MQTTTNKTTLDDLECTSPFWYPLSKQTMLEIGRYAWADEQQLRRRLGTSMRRLLLDNGLLAQWRVATNTTQTTTTIATET